MTNEQFLLDLAQRLERLERASPNLNLHWFDVARLRLVAAELEARGVQLEGMKAAIDGLMTRSVASIPGSLLRPATKAPVDVDPLTLKDITRFKPEGFA